MASEWSNSARKSIKKVDPKFDLGHLGDLGDFFTKRPITLEPGTKRP